VSDSLFPKLDTNDVIADTRNAMQAYARVLGDCLKVCRSKRKHWWHASLRPSLNGLTTGVVRATADFELELDFRHAELHARARNDNGFDVALNGQSAVEIGADASFSIHRNGDVSRRSSGRDEPDSTLAASF
jgi:hypothetical protein